VLAVFRRRDFSLLWVAGLVSVAGDWVLMTALPYFVYVETGSTLATAGMTVAELAPAIVLTSPAGVLADRWDRGRVLVSTNLVQAAVVSALLLVGSGQLWVVYGAAALQSAAGSLAGPAESALLPVLVPPSMLVEANAMNALNNRLGRLAGVPLGAALLSWWGLNVVVVVDTLTFVAAAALVASIAAPPPSEPAEEAVAAAESALVRFWQEWVAGLRVVREDRTISPLFVVFGLMTFGGTMLDPLFVPWVRDHLDEGVDVVALLIMASSVSGIVGSLAVGVLGSRLPARSLIGWGSLLAGAMLLVKFQVPVLGVAVALSVLGGITAVASSVGVDTLAQERTPEAVRGRVFGSLQASSWLMSLLGAALGGILGEVAGLLPALDLAAILVGLSGAVALLLVPPDRADSRSRRSPGRRTCPADD
jgi:MFS family permease